MLRAISDFWMRFMFWLNTSTIPLWVICLALAVVIACLIAMAWRDLHDALHDPPPRH